MGTNYYLESDVCPHCGRSAERLHIGKSSAGWCFGLHIIPERGINDLSYWMAEFSKPNTKIVDEYGDAVPVNQMLAVITERGRDSAIWEKKPYGYDSWSDRKDCYAIALATWASSTALARMISAPTNSLNAYHHGN